MPTTRSQAQSELEEQERWQKHFAETEERFQKHYAELAERRRKHQLWVEIRDKENRERIIAYNKEMDQLWKQRFREQEKEEAERWPKKPFKEKCDDCKLTCCLIFNPLGLLPLLLSFGSLGNSKPAPALYNVRHPDTATTLTNPPKRPAHTLDIISQKLRKADLDQTQIESLVHLENMTDAEKTRILQICEACAEVTKLMIEDDEFCGPQFKYCTLLK